MMGTKQLPSADVLHQILRHEPEDGLLFWKRRPDHFFGSEGSAKSWNKQFAGKQAFTSRDSNGYYRGGIFGTVYRAHRVIWALVHGCDPEYIDHINGDPSDNRIDNLRSVSASENAMNCRKPKTNTSGYHGVHWNEANQKWLATMTVRGRSIYLGSFESKKDAARARRVANRKYGFHENHGR